MILNTMAFEIKHNWRIIWSNKQREAFCIEEYTRTASLRCHQVDAAIVDTSKTTDIGAP